MGLEVELIAGSSFELCAQREGPRGRVKGGGCWDVVWCEGLGLGEQFGLLKRKNERQIDHVARR